MHYWTWAQTIRMICKDPCIEIYPDDLKSKIIPETGNHLLSNTSWQSYISLGSHEALKTASKICSFNLKANKVYVLCADVKIIAAFSVRWSSHVDLNSSLIILKDIAIMQSTFHTMNMYQVHQELELWHKSHSHCLLSYDYACQFQNNYIYCI